MGLKQPPKKVVTFSNPWEKTKHFNHPGIAFLQRNFGITKILWPQVETPWVSVPPSWCVPKYCLPNSSPEIRFFPGRQTALRRRPGSLLCSSGLSKCKKKGLSRFTGRVRGRGLFFGGGRGGFEWHFYFRVIFFFRCLSEFCSFG